MAWIVLPELVCFLYSKIHPLVVKCVLCDYHQSAQSQGSADAPPQFAKAFGQVDMSVNYDIDDNFTVFFEGLNLNNETEQSYGRYEEQFLSANQYGTRYTLGMRYSFK